MSLLNIAQIGHPGLSKTAETIPEEKIKNPEIQKLIDDMIETLREEDGVGISAPQVHEPKRIILIHFNPAKNTHRKTRIPLTVIINPEIVKKSKQRLLDWEGCLSVTNGNLYGLVPRYKKIIITGFDRDGNKIRFTAFNLKARVIQHEIDHLDGILFIQRMRKEDMPSLTSKKYFLKYHKPRWPKPKTI